MHLTFAPIPPSVATTPPTEAALGTIPGQRVAQNGRLPLHHAAEKGATLDVVKLLLAAESDAATAGAADKARRCASNHANRACRAITPRPNVPPAQSLPVYAVLGAFGREALPRVSVPLNA